MSEFFSSRECCTASGSPCPSGMWVEAVEFITVLPVSPIPMQIYVIDEGAIGDLASHIGEFAYWSDTTSQWEYCEPLEGQKLTVAGDCMIYCWDGDAWTELFVAPVVYASASIGAGTPVYAATIGSTFQFRSLVAGANVSLALVDGGNSIRISSATPPAGGEANSGVSIGGGTAIYVDKVGLNLRFRSLAVSGNITMSEAAGLITLNVPPPGPSGSSSVNVYSRYDPFGGQDLRVFGEVGGVAINLNTSVVLHAAFQNVSASIHKVLAAGVYRLEGTVGVEPGSGNAKLEAWWERSINDGLTWTEVPGTRAGTDGSGEVAINVSVHTAAMALTLGVDDLLRLMGSVGVGNIPQLTKAGRSAIVITKLF